MTAHCLSLIDDLLVEVLIAALTVTVSHLPIPVPGSVLSQPFFSEKVIRHPVCQETKAISFFPLKDKKGKRHMVRRIVYRLVCCACRCLLCCSQHTPHDASSSSRHAKLTTLTSFHLLLPFPQTLLLLLILIFLQETGSRNQASSRLRSYSLSNLSFFPLY